MGASDGDVALGAAWERASVSLVLALACQMAASEWVLGVEVGRFFDP